MSPLRCCRLLPGSALLLILTACSEAGGTDLQQVTSRGMLYTVAAVDLKRDTLRLHWKNPTTDRPYGTFREVTARLRKQGERVLFATNSGIYAPGLRPLGLHVERGQMLIPSTLR